MNSELSRKISDYQYELINFFFGIEKGEELEQEAQDEYMHGGE